MFEMISSKEYRDFLDKNKIVLSDWEKAALIFNYRTASYDEKIDTLMEIQSNTVDGLLKDQIEERISRVKLYFEKFKENSGNAFYCLSPWYEGGFEADGIYPDFQSAYEAGLKEKTLFQIEKEFFECKKNAGEGDEVVGCVEFSLTGELNRILWLHSRTEGDAAERVDIERFENIYVDLPLMFRRGDIVHIIGTEKLGIVESPVDDADESHYRQCAIHGDYSDWQVTVNLMYDGNKFLSVFSHEHIAPAELEYAEFADGDVRKGMMEYMVKTLYDNSLLNGSGRDAGRISAVVSALETVWKQYPDMRLGQLLINVCGKPDLFSIEDEKLLERLQYNTFSMLD